MKRSEAKKLSKSWNKIGEWIRQQREMKEWTQKELADKLRNTFQPDVSFWESGEHIPDARVCMKLAKLFNVDVRNILALAMETRLARQIQEVTSN